MLNRRVQERISYIVRLEPGVWTPEQTLTAGKGSCRDSAWLLVQLLRHLGYAARFVSGYLIQLVADIKPLEGPEGPTADFTDLHAWTEVYLPGAGWIGLDADLRPDGRRGPYSAGGQPRPAIGRADHRARSSRARSHSTSPCRFRRIRETPRVTKPYTDRQWQDILAAGARVDRALAAGDVRLTFGGEPTFVCATDQEAPEWNTAALGPTKRRYASRLHAPAGALWSPGAALHHGQGKQYPGEQLPRWALSAHWRADGEKVWLDPGLLADPDRDRDTATAEDAARFAALLAERLQVDPGHGDAGARRRALLPVEGAPAAGQRGRRGQPAARPAGAGAAWRRCSARAWPRRSAACCRCAASPDRHRAGRPGAGSCAATRCS